MNILNFGLMSPLATMQLIVNISMIVWAAYSGVMMIITRKDEQYEMHRKNFAFSLAVMFVVASVILLGEWQ